jgi:hypothetical protein
MASYEDNIFINCPFDRAYRATFHALVFVVHECGYFARNALEIEDSGQIRIQKIQELISDCRLGIHDISRTEPEPESKLPRFNMPLELGLFLGAKHYGDALQQTKSCKILDTERFRYQKFCSDIAGQDISAHGGDPERAIKAVRDWLRAHRPSVSIPSGSGLVRRYYQFQDDLPTLCESLRLDADELTFIDFQNIVIEWLRANAW